MLSYVRSESVVSRVIAGETLIIPVRKGVGDLASIFSLNGVASLIWNVLEQPCDRERIIGAVEESYAVEHETAASDVQEFLDQMCSVGLVCASATGVAA